jgi:TonB family protein
VKEEAMFSRQMISVLFLGCALLTGPGKSVIPKAAVAPKYPPLAALARVSGNVVIRVEIDASGSVTKAELVSGHPLLAKGALDAARRWRFESEPIQARTTEVKFKFVMLPEQSESNVETTFFPPDKVEVRYTPAKPPVNYRRKHPGP